MNDDCPATLSSNDTYLCCALPKNHGGLHYDKIDDVSWKAGEPGE